MGVGGGPLSMFLEPQNGNLTQAASKVWEEGLGSFPEERKAEQDPMFLFSLLIIFSSFSYYCQPAGDRPE